MKGKILILEDDIVLAEQIAKVMKRLNTMVLLTVNSDQFFDELRMFQPDVILLDVFSDRFPTEWHPGVETSEKTIWT
jgi:DNA-binding response OmpR family regulator